MKLLLIERGFLHQEMYEPTANQRLVRVYQLIPLTQAFHVKLNPTTPLRGEMAKISILRLRFLGEDLMMAVSKPRK